MRLGPEPSDVSLRGKVVKALIEHTYSDSRHIGICWHRLVESGTINDGGLAGQTRVDSLCRVLLN